jgi:hypothetical protein
MDFDIHLGQGSADNVGVRLLEQFESIQHHLARRMLPAHAQQCRVSKARDYARVRHRLSRRRIE